MVVYYTSNIHSGLGVQLHSQTPLHANCMQTQTQPMKNTGRQRLEWEMEGNEKIPYPLASLFHLLHSCSPNFNLTIKNPPFFLAFLTLKINLKTVTFLLQVMFTWLSLWVTLFMLYTLKRNLLASKKSYHSIYQSSITSFSSLLFSIPKKLKTFALQAKINSTSKWFDKYVIRFNSIWLVFKHMYCYNPLENLFIYFTVRMRVKWMDLFWVDLWGLASSSEYRLHIMR